MSPSKTCREQKHRNTGRLRLKETVAPSDKHGWIDPIDTVEARETVSVLEGGRVCVCGCEVGRSPGQLREPGCVRVHECVLSCRAFCGLRPAGPVEAGSSSDSRQPGFVSASAGFAPLLYPSLTDAGRGREKAFISRLLQLHTLFCLISHSHNPPLPPRLASSYPLPRYSCLSLSLSLSLGC